MSLMKDDPYFLGEEGEEFQDAVQEEAELLGNLAESLDKVNTIGEDSVTALHSSMEWNFQQIREEFVLLKGDVQRLQVQVRERDKKIEDQGKQLVELKVRVSELEKQKSRPDVSGEQEKARMEKLRSTVVDEAVEKMRKSCQIRVTGIPEPDKESQTSLMKAAKDLVEGKMKVADGAKMLVDVFRVGKKGEDRLGRPRIVILRTSSVGHRNEILKGKRNLGKWREIGVDVDRTKAELDTWRKGWQQREQREKSTRGGPQNKEKRERVEREDPISGGEEKVEEVEELARGTWVEVVKKGKAYMEEQGDEEKKERGDEEMPLVVNRRRLLTRSMRGKDDRPELREKEDQLVVYSKRESMKK